MLELQRSTRSDDAARVFVVLLLGGTLVFGEFWDFNLVLVLGTFEEPIDVETGQVDFLGLDVADFYNLFGFDDCAV